MNDEELVTKAIHATKNAHAIYSNYKVGAALLATNGEVYTAGNIENVSYGLTTCAERNAISKAISSGNKDFSAIAVVTKDGGFPCGACRQVMHEFAPELKVIVADTSGEISYCTTIAKLLPFAFSSFE